MLWCWNIGASYSFPDVLFGRVRAHAACVLKDTRLLGVGHWRRAARRHVAVEGHLQSVAVGRVVQQATQETPARPCLHHVSVEGRVGLSWWDGGGQHDKHTQGDS